MPIYHIVLIKLKKGISPCDATNVRAGLYSLHSLIPAISDLKLGPRIRHPLDHDFDLGVVFIFEDEDTLKNEFLTHEEHTSYEEYSEPFIEDKVVFDLHCE